MSASINGENGTFCPICGGRPNQDSGYIIFIGATSGALAKTLSAPMKQRNRKDKTKKHVDMKEEDN